MKYYCNKCNKEFLSIKELNGNERAELEELGCFVCSGCINDEMELEEND